MIQGPNHEYECSRFKHADLIIEVQNVHLRNNYWYWYRYTKQVKVQVWCCCKVWKGVWWGLRTDRDWSFGLSNNMLVSEVSYHG